LRIDIESCLSSGALSQTIERRRRASKSGADFMAKILLADDDAATRDLVRRALEMDGHKVTATQDGMEALERLSGGDRFDVLVTDVQMPGLDGIALAERAAAAIPGIAILLMSGFPEQLEKSKRIASARVATLSKPFTLEQARAAVRGVVG
jgi:CheY-like chemotaxis protein